tara:strand:+ start:427 stop:789 length:363 start_codon:yes stop_codon:yes gene_type:complete
MKKLLSLTSIFLFSTSLSAMAVETILDLHEGDDLDKQIVYIAMHNAGEAIAWTNVGFENQHGVKLFCEFPKLDFSGEEYFNLLKDFYEGAQNAGIYTDENGPHMVGIVLLGAIVAKYKCD